MQTEYSGTPKRSARWLCFVLAVAVFLAASFTGFPGVRAAAAEEPPIVTDNEAAPELSPLLSPKDRFGGLPVSAPPVEAGDTQLFWDVPEDAWYRDSVYALTRQGIIVGTGERQFSPGQLISRAALVTMLARLALNEEELLEYREPSPFHDVAETHWGLSCINWAKENGVVNGYGDGSFHPDDPVSRQELAVMMANFSHAMARPMQALRETAAFADQAEIGDFALASVQACQGAGILNGYEDNSFRPRNNATRAEAAAVFSRFLQACPQRTDYRVIRKRVNGLAVRGVELDPSRFTADLVNGGGMIYGGETAASAVFRSGAVIAVNGSFFDMDTMGPLGTLIRGGRVLSTLEWYAPDKSALTLSGDGRFSVQSFSTSLTATARTRQGRLLRQEGIACNILPYYETDHSNVVFTEDWGRRLGFSVSDGIAVDAEGRVLAVAHGADMEIPQGGWVLAHRARYDVDPFFDGISAGDLIALQPVYGGADSQDIVLSVGAGPRLVKNGAIYGSLTTYRAEGFTDSAITTSPARRMCVGILPDGKLVILTAYATLTRLSLALVRLGCTDAINLDGGGSSNLYVNGTWIIGPGSRSLNNVIVFR